MHKNCFNIYICELESICPCLLRHRYKQLLDKDFCEKAFFVTYDDVHLV